MVNKESEAIIDHNAEQPTNLFDPSNLDHRNIQSGMDGLLYAIEAYRNQDEERIAKLRNQLIGQTSTVKNGIQIAKEIFDMHMDKKTQIDESFKMASRRDKLARNSLNAVMGDDLIIRHIPVVPSFNLDTAS